MPDLISDFLLAADPVQLAASAGLQLDEWQKRVVRSTARQQILCVTRQGGKSTACAVMAVHEALYKPASLTLVTAPSQRQAVELLVKVKALCNGSGTRASQESVLSVAFPNQSRILALPGSEATIRGYSANLVLVDEAARVPDALLDAVRPMLAATGGRLVLLSTPWGKRGGFYEAWQNGGAFWERTKVTAFDISRFDAQWLEQERQQTPPLVFASEYECEFTDTELQVFGSDLVYGALSSEVQPLLPLLPPSPALPPSLTSGEAA